jgi:hypothetical protein
MATKKKPSAPELRSNHKWPDFVARCGEVEPFLAEEGEIMDWAKWSSKLDLAGATIKKLRDGNPVIEGSAKKSILKMNLIRKRFRLESLVLENEYKIS